MIHFIETHNIPITRACNISYHASFVSSGNSHILEIPRVTTRVAKLVDDMFRNIN